METKKAGVGFGVMILKDNKVLLGQRHIDPQKADSELHGERSWTMPGGKIHFGESFEDCCYREVNEETGIKININKIKLISVANDKVSDAHFVTIGFLCEELEGTPKVLEPDEITCWKGFELDKLPSTLFFSSEKVLNNYINKKIYN